MPSSNRAATKQLYPSGLAQHRPARRPLAGGHIAVELIDDAFSRKAQPPPVRCTSASLASRPFSSVPRRWPSHWGFLPRSNPSGAIADLRFEGQEHTLTRPTDQVSLDLHRTFHLLPRAAQLMPVLWPRHDELLLNAVAVPVPDAASVGLLVLLHAKTAGHRSSPLERLSRRCPSRRTTCGRRVASVGRHGPSVGRRAVDRGRTARARRRTRNATRPFSLPRYQTRPMAHRPSTNRKHRRVPSLQTAPVLVYERLQNPPV